MPRRAMSTGTQRPCLMMRVRNARLIASSADFLDEIVSLMHDGVAMFDRACNSYSPHAGGVTLHFSNQPDAEADVIIASDGINSRLRSHLYHRQGLPVKSQMARYSEWVAWRG
jgi:2-polyprenyl-6-methoxyphenol hydroxylase-like FAD-dependent oxidoreductase